MYAAEFGSTGALEILVFHKLLAGNGTYPFKLVSCPGVMPAHVPGCAATGRVAIVEIARIPRTLRTNPPDQGNETELYASTPAESTLTLVAKRQSPEHLDS